MKSDDYANSKHVKVGPVEIIGKMKACGHENCNGCPHGPFWYAYICAPDSMIQTRAEIYLGRRWSDGDLRMEVAPRLLPVPRREFLKVIEAAVRSERIVWLEHEGAQVAQSIKDTAARAQKDIAKLRRDEAGIKKELHDLRSK